MKKYLIFIPKLILLVGLISVFGAETLFSQAPEVIDSDSSKPSENVLPFKKCWFGGPFMFKLGEESDEVKQLQSLLAQDKNIYPEGLITGYFGQLTQRAIKRLQKQYGLPETGVVDENLRQIIFPCINIRVTYPNGGEKFKTGETMKISWEVEMPSYEILKPSSLGSEIRLKLQSLLPKSVKPEISSQDQKQNQNNQNLVRPFPPILSIDLVEEGKCVRVQCFSAPCPPICGPRESRVVFHIRNVSVYSKEGGTGSIEWNIPNSIPDSQNYKIRISSGKRFVNPACPNCPVIQGFPSYSWRVFDESDGTFSILGGTKITPTPFISPMPVPTFTPDMEQLTRLREDITVMMKKLQEMLNILEQMLKNRQ